MSRRDAGFRVMVNIARFRTFNAIVARAFSPNETGMIGTKVIPQYWSLGGTVTDQMEATHEKDQYCTLGWRRRSVREQRHGCRPVYQRRHVSRHEPAERGASAPGLR